MIERRNLALLALWLVAACRLEHSLVEADIPETVTHVAVLVLDEDGQILDGSPLRAVQRDRPFGIASPSRANTVLVGYSDPQLAPYDAKGRADLVRSSPLERAEGCAPRLPIPEWTGFWDGTEDIVTSSQAGPVATAAFLNGRCPDLVHLDIDIDPRCASTRCSVGASISMPCRVDLDLSECGLEPAQVTIDALGRSCIEWGRNEPLCEALPGIAPAIEQLECGGENACRHDLYVTLDKRVAPFQTDTVTLFEAPPFVHSSLLRSIIPVPRARMRYTGYALDLVVLGPRVLVAAVADGFAAQECSRLAPRQILSYDADTLALLDSRSAPSCLTHMLSDPSGDGFLATIAQDGLWQLGRFDQFGRLLEAQPFDSRAEAGPNEAAVIEFLAFEPVEISFVDGTRRVAVLFDRRRDFDMTPPRSIVTVHDPSTLQVEARHDLPADTDARSLTAQGNLLVMASPFKRSILWVDAVGGGLVDEVLLEQDTLALSSFSTISTFGNETLLLVGVTGGERSLLGITGRRDPERMLVFDRDMDSFAQIPWPADPSRLIVGGIALAGDGEWEGIVTFNEPDRRRFSPDTWKLGTGLVSQLEADEAGRVFALLPWIPALVRLTPQP